MRNTMVWGIACFAWIGVAMIVGSESAHAQDKPVQNLIRQLDDGWQFRKTPAGAEDTENGWLAATVPGDVHLDLLANKMIADSFFRDNEARLQWIENESWEYRSSFDATPKLLTYDNVDLVFDGLDAAAQAYLNGAQILDADNMFRVWRVPVRGRLHPGKHLLRVVFPSLIIAAQKASAIDLTTGAAQISRNLIYLVSPNDVHLTLAQLTLEITGASDSFDIRVTSPVLARSVNISFGSLDTRLSGNYFDLLPGETREIRVIGAASLDMLRAQLHIISFTDAFEAKSQPVPVSAE